MSGIIKDNEGRSSGLVKSTTVAEYDDDKLQSNIALLGFKTAVNGSLAKYNLQDQIIDEYEDTSGIDSGASTYVSRNASGGYYGGMSGDTPTGGTITSHSTYTVHSFLLAQTGTDFTPGVSGNVSAMVVGGGGGGGQGYGGGGGAGGFRTDASFAVLADTAYTITVGAGGTGRTSGGDQGADGGDSIFSTITSTGGGGGGSSGGTDGGGMGNDALGRHGGSGGGGGLSGHPEHAGGNSSPVTSPVQGYAGSEGFDAGTVPGNSGGGGGGATETPSNATSGNGADGGAGTTNDYQTGSSQDYAGGGAGGSGSSAGTATHGGGNGANGNGAAGTDNTGGGGGSGGGSATADGGDGGNGIVVIRFTTDDFIGVGAVSDITLQSTDTTAMAEPDYADMVMLMENGAGTATINTDIKGWISKDSGSTFTQGTLVDEGTWGTNKKILAFHDLDISAQSGTSMCYKITMHNQSAGSKETRVHATSIGWKA